MLFRKMQPRSCAYCTHCTKIDDTVVLCIKRGIVAVDSACRKFSYDPCKRIPLKGRMPDYEKFNSEDFSL